MTQQNWEEEFDKEYYDEAQFECDVHERQKSFIRQLISHSTTQLVEKIKGEVEGLKLDNQDQAWNKLCAVSMNDVGLAEGSMELFNQALQEVIKIISKYK